MDSTQVGILISLKTAGFGALSGNISSLSKLSAGLEKVGKNVTGLNEKIAKIGTLKANIDTNVGKISGELSKWQSTLATAASFVVPVKLAVDFESSMAEVKKYVDFKSEDEVKKFRRADKTAKSRTWHKRKRASANFSLWRTAWT